MTKSNIQAEWFFARPWIDDPDRDIEAYCKSHSESLYDLKQKLHEWRRDGVVIFENAVDLISIEKFDRDLDWIVNNPKALPISLEIEGSLRAIGDYTTADLKKMLYLKFYGLHAFSPAGRELCLTLHVTTFLRHIFAARPAPMSTLTFLRGSQQVAHADFPFVFKQKRLPLMAASWIPIEDVHPDSGPLVYYPGSHKVENIGFYDFGNGQLTMREGNASTVVNFGKWLHERFEEQGILQKVYLPKRGDVLIWHAALVHEGLPIGDSQRTRKSLVTHYTTAEQMPDDHIKLDANGKPLLFEKGPGVIFQYPWVDYNHQVP